MLQLQAVLAIYRSIRRLLWGGEQWAGQNVFCVSDVANDVFFQKPGNDNSWITLKLIGDLSNKASIVAKVKLEYIPKDGSSQMQYQTVNAGSSLQLESGLSSAKEIQKVIDTWPNMERSQSVYGDLKLNISCKIFEKENRVELIEI